MPRGRPKKEIDSEQFEKLCALHCTLKEIADWFQCAEDTIQRWCQRQYGKTFSEAFDQFSAQGKISLRRYQFRMAEHNVTMAIWLGKQWLGQTDVVVTAEAKNGQLDAILECLKMKD